MFGFNSFIIGDRTNWYTDLKHIYMKAKGISLATNNTT